jgi:hypothetical protein
MMATRNSSAATFDIHADSANVTTSSLPPRPKIIFYGDSIGTEVNWFLPRYIREHTGGTVYLRTFGGTNACKWIEDAQRDQYLDADIVLMVFTGADFVTCMQKNGKPLRDLVRIYKTVHDSKQLASMFPNAQVFFIGYARSEVEQLQLDRGKTPLSSILNTLFKIAAQEQPNWHYLDGESPLYLNGRWSERLACKWFDQRACENGTVQVRAPDGAHMCPGEAALDGLTVHCSMHNSGAIRLMHQIVRSVTKVFSGSS